MLPFFLSKFQKLAKSEEEDVVGNYFKPHRASKLVAQAQETQRGKNSSILFTNFSVSAEYIVNITSVQLF